MNARWEEGEGRWIGLGNRQELKMLVDTGALQVPGLLPADVIIRVSIIFSSGITPKTGSTGFIFRLDDAGAVWKYLFLPTSLLSWKYPV